jgi:hypothetical protein
VTRLSSAENRLSIAGEAVLQVAHFGGQRQNACAEKVQADFFLADLPSPS